MPFISGRRAFLELLRQEGVEMIFGNPGTTELVLMDALAAEEKPRYVLGLQEAVVMAMASGYALACGRLAVANLHVAPGLGNAMGMLYDAQKAGAPVLVTAGQHDQGFSATEPFLWADLPTIARPFVKWSAEIRRLADLPLLVHRAAKTALAPPTGPVFLSLPADVLKSEGEIDLGAPTRVAPRIRGDAAAIDAAGCLLASAAWPAIIVGDAVARGEAHGELVELAEQLAAPVFLEGIDSSAAFPTSHALFRGQVTRVASTIRELLDRRDVLLSVGADLFPMSLPPDVDPVPPGLKIVHLDTDPWELAKNYPAAVAILGDPKATLPELTRSIAAHMTGAQQARARERLAAIRASAAADRERVVAAARAESQKTPMRALAVLQAVGETLPADAIVVDETISSGPGLRHLVVSDDPHSFFAMRGGGIGWGLPAAVGIRLARPSRPVVALIGDGSAMYGIQSLWTAAHERVTAVFVILNNRSYRVLKQRVKALEANAAQTGRYVGMDLTEPAIDFVGLARSLGVAGERASTLDAVRETLARALSAGEPRLIEVELDSSLDPR